MNRNVLNRCIWFHDELMNDRYPNARKIKDKFSVSERTGKVTINKYQDEFKIEIKYVRSKHGFYLNDKKVKGPGEWLNQNEWLSLLMAEKVLEGETGSIKDEIQALIEKFKGNYLSSTFIKELRKHVTCNIKINYMLPTVFSVLLLSILNKQQVRIEYSSPWYQDDEKNYTWDTVVSEKVISPQHIIHENGDWILVAWSRTKGLRNYRPSRIVSAAIIKEGDFHEVPYSELEQYINDSYGAFKGVKKEEAVMLFSQEASMWAYEMVWHPKAFKKRLPNRQLELHLPFADEKEIIQLILSFGEKVTVLKPVWLKEKLVDTIEKMKENYSMGT